jgi:RNA polymerase sigma-70 factor (ECF subfamily)
MGQPYDLGQTSRGKLLRSRDLPRKESPAGIATTGRSSGAIEISTTRVDSLRRGLSTAVARICPFWMSQEREDLVQTALLRIVGLLGSGESHREVTATYIWKTAYSVTLDEIRRARWRYERSMEHASQGEDRPGTALDPERAASAREICPRVRECLRSLEISRRRAVLLRLAGYSHGEAAQRLGMNVKQIANFIHRGMKDLRTCLRAKGVNG